MKLLFVLGMLVVAAFLIALSTALVRPLLAAFQRGRSAPPAAPLAGTTSMRLERQRRRALRARLDSQIARF